MKNPLDMIQQKRLGYLILDGKEVPVINERLRNVPLDDWRGRELGVEFKAQIELLGQRVQQHKQRVDEMQWLRGVTEPFWKDNPDALMGELVELLSEPDRTKARAILYRKVPVDALPIERVNRQPWHRSIENAIAALIQKGEFTMDDILAEAGIEKNSIERFAAAMYAQRIMNALTSYPANVALPRPQAAS